MSASGRCAVRVWIGGAMLVLVRFCTRSMEENRTCLLMERFDSTTMIKERRGGEKKHNSLCVAINGPTVLGK
jgi:hypothetical protein